jgi:AAA ATPase domain
MGGTERRSPAETVIVGRDAERVVLTRFLNAGARAWSIVHGGAADHGATVRDGGDGTRVAAILTGPAGIGKTALWEWALERASSAGYLVLLSRAGIAETQLPWVGLTDLLRTVPASVLTGLPRPQGHALQVVMLQSGPGEPVDERAVGTALWSVLSVLAGSQPVLIALDDLPYLDAASAGALRFALRRVGPDTPVRLVATAPGRRVPVGAAGRPARQPGAASRNRPRHHGRAVRVAGGSPGGAALAARPAAGAAGTAAAWRFTDAGLESGAVERAALAGVVIVDQCRGIRSSCGRRIRW